MVRRLRSSSSHPNTSSHTPAKSLPSSHQNGLVLANGGLISHQHVLCLSCSPRKDGSAYPSANPLPELLISEEAPIVEALVEGECVIEVSPFLLFCPLTSVLSKQENKS